MKKLVSLFAAILCLSLLLTACGGGGTNSNTDPNSNSAEEITETEKVIKDTITFSPRLDFATMDVQNTPSIVTKSIYYLVYNTLVEKDVESNSIIPALAESWTQDSPTEYTFKLRQGVKFHDGSDFTADDVVFTVQLAKESKGSASKVTSVESVTAVDSNTVKVVLNKPNMDFLDLLTDTSLSILSKTAFETLGDEKGIQQGTGPYKYVEWNQGAYLDLTLNDNYWGEKPATKNLRVQYVSEAASRLIAVKTGELDFCQDFPIAELPNISADPNLQLITYPSATIDFIAFNMNSKAMSDVNVRKAVSYALNRQDIVDGAFMGNAVPLNNIMHSSNAYYSEIKAAEYDADKAKELLAAAGYADGLELTMICNTAAERIAAVTIVQAALDEVGITLKIETMDNATVTSTCSSGTGYDMVYSTWSGYSFGPDNGIREMLYSNGSNNYCHLSDAKMDKMIDDALVIQDTDARMAAYKEIEEYSEELMAVYPVLVENYGYVAGKHMEPIPQPNGPIQYLRDLVAYEG